MFDVRVCEGRMCTSAGGDPLKDRAVAVLEAHPEGDRCRLSRGGCFGLCDVAANVVVRRFAKASALPPVDQDRLTLTGKKNETVYSGLAPDDVERVLRAHLEADAVVGELTQAAREASQPPQSPIAARLRELRKRRAGRR